MVLGRIQPQEHVGAKNKATGCIIALARAHGTPGHHVKALKAVCHKSQTPWCCHPHASSKKELRHLVLTHPHQPKTGVELLTTSFVVQFCCLIFYGISG